MNAAPAISSDDHVTIRFSREDEDASIHRLAQLDSAPRPAGDILVAEVGGQLRAALPIGGGTAIADPFHPTADLVRLLELRRDQAAEARGRRRFGLRLLRLVPDHS